MRDAIRAFALAALALLTASAQPAVADTMTLAYVGHPAVPKANPLPLDEPAPDEGVAGARLGIVDDNGTGRFTAQEFVLKQTIVPADASVLGAVKSLPPDVRFVITDLSANELAEVARAFPQLTFLNASAPDDALRREHCAVNVLHTIPSRAMLTDALAQYLALKKWSKWLLVVGPEPADKLYADAVKRSAQKFGAQIVAEKPWTFQTANAHADTGHATLQTEIPAFTRGSDYDVVVVADDAGLFGEELIGRTDLPRPIAGTQGLVPTGWSPINVQWGALQLQDRFYKKFHRHMTAKDYAAWIAARALGEAAVRAHSSDPEQITKFVRGPDFLVSGFKGEGQSFRPWNGQMRQPILIAGAHSLVSVSPQDGFLHRRSVLDTLGVDEGESRCKM
jgi:ABC transporter substrate binding protein (PQQ-dependent alcohol dehydrogenase system)